MAASVLPPAHFQNACFHCTEPLRARSEYFRLKKQPGPELPGFRAWQVPMQPRSTCCLLLSNRALRDGDRLRWSCLGMPNFHWRLSTEKMPSAEPLKGFGWKLTPELPPAPCTVLKHCNPHSPWYAHEDAGGTTSFLLLRGGSFLFAFHGSHY